MKVLLLACSLLLPFMFSACSDSATEGDNTSPGNPSFYESLQEDALAFEYNNGEWLEDYGDAAAYGPNFYLHAGLGTSRENYLEIARAARSYNLRAVEQATGNFFWYLNNLEEVFMAMMGLVEYAGVSGEADLIAPLDELIGATDFVVWLLGDYVNVSIGEFAADLYGPTAITGGMALTYLQYATYLDTPARGLRIRRAAAIVDAVDTQAWNVNHYRFKPGEDRLFLYPNSIMMITLSRLYELTGETRYLERAETVYQGIQPLHDLEKGFYQSPYSQEYQGAETDVYSTLSSQNYLMLGLTLMVQNTGNELYLNDLLSILDHVRIRLYDTEQGKLLHHWIDGHIALPSDPDYFCSGCNLQTLYIIRYLQDELGITVP